MDYGRNQTLHCLSVEKISRISCFCKTDVSVLLTWSKEFPQVRGVLTFPKRDKFDRVKALASQQPLRTFFNRKVQIGPHIPCIALKV